MSVSVESFGLCRPLLVIWRGLLGCWGVDLLVVRDESFFCLLSGFEFLGVGFVAGCWICLFWGFGFLRVGFVGEREK